MLLGIASQLIAQLMKVRAGLARAWRTLYWRVDGSLYR
jgi:hypothetical protein